MTGIHAVASAGRRADIPQDQTNIRWFQGMPAVICSLSMKKVMHFVGQVGGSSAAVLISGESGTGKELVARALHECSPRSAKPWVDINCAALPDHLLESELFGFEKGAFSGADSAKPGLFELAHQGTLFLDEVAELSQKSQAKLLRVLDGYPYYRLGGTRKVDVNVRIVAATNADLEQQVRAGRFRADLFHRLNQVCITVPPLRHRTEDIAPLARFFLAREHAGLTLSCDAAEALNGYAWPGNVRELRSLMARLAMTVQSCEIGREDLPPEFRPLAMGEPASSTYSLDKLEEEVILHALEQAEGRRKEAAELLGISPRTLMRRLKTYEANQARRPVCVGLECN